MRNCKPRQIAFSMRRSVATDRTRYASSSPDARTRMRRTGSSSRRSGLRASSRSRPRPSVPSHFTRYLVADTPGHLTAFAPSTISSGTPRPDSASTCRTRSPRGELRTDYTAVSRVARWRRRSWRSTARDRCSARRPNTKRCSSNPGCCSAGGAGACRAARRAVPMPFPSRQFDAINVMCRSLPVSEWYSLAAVCSASRTRRSSGRRLSPGRVSTLT